MLTLLIITILFLCAVVFFIAYYNYVARFHRIQLFGREKKKSRSYAGFLPAFNLTDIFVRSDDLRMLRLLMMRKLPVVVCLGDSITHGIISTNYVELLQQKYMGKILFVNSGINGNLAYNLKIRLKHDCTDFDPDFITILIGTNDVNSNKDPKTLTRYMKFQKLPCKPDYSFFYANLEETIRELQKTTRAQIALLSLPVIGENLNSRLNRLAVQYSEGIKELAMKYKVSYLALNERQHAFLAEKRQGIQDNSHKKNLFLTFLLMMRRGFDGIAAANGRFLTYDDLHETSLGAEMIVELISSWLNN